MTTKVQNAGRQHGHFNKVTTQWRIRRAMRPVRLAVRRFRRTIPGLKRQHNGPERHVLLRYLSSALIFRTLLSSSILIALMEILALLEQMTPILQRHLGMMGVLTFMTLRLPLMLQNALPLSMLIGALVLLTQMTISNEISVLRASGLSTLALVRLLLPATLLIGLVGAVVEDQVTPRAELALAAWWNRTDPQPETGQAFWVHLGHDVVHVGYVSQAGRVLHGIDFYRRDAQGIQIAGTVHAMRAEHDAQGWMLKEVDGVDISRADTEGVAELPLVPERKWPNPLAPRDMLMLSMDAPPLSISTILSILNGHTPSPLTLGYLKAALFERLLRPCAMAVMLLLALPVIYIPPRAGFRSWLPVWCLGGGLMFIIMQGMFRAMGDAGLLPATVATVPGLLVFTCAAGWALLRNEDK